MGISKAQFEKLTGKKAPSTKAKIKIKKAEPKGIRFIKEVLQQKEIEFVCEHKFHDVRKFRLDIAIIDLKIGIEYEGIISEKSRHTAKIGYTNDCEKYNLAQLSGWRVLRYTAINYKDFLNDVNKL